MSNPDIIAAKLTLVRRHSYITAHVSRIFSMLPRPEQGVLVNDCRYDHALGQRDTPATTLVQNIKTTWKMEID